MNAHRIRFLLPLLLSCILATTAPASPSGLQDDGDSAPLAYMGLASFFEACIEGEPAHAYVRQAVPGSPADRAGLKAGDRILAVDGEPLDFEDQYRWTAFLLHRARPGEEIRFQVSRGEELLDLRVVPEAASASQAQVVEGYLQDLEDCHLRGSCTRCSHRAPKVVSSPWTDLYEAVLDAGGTALLTVSRHEAGFSIHSDDVEIPAELRVEEDELLLENAEKLALGRSMRMRVQVSRNDARRLQANVEILDYPGGPLPGSGWR
ncbi:MAG: PDZ domain-containing protein [Holophagales bacterium]|nr:PDZ domain-containing protein [Holophagales bacterium]